MGETLAKTTTGALAPGAPVNLEPALRPTDRMGGHVVQGHVDAVGEVLTLPETDYERHPPTMDPQWRENSTGIYRLNGQLLVVLDVSRLLAIGSRAEAA